MIEVLDGELVPTEHLPVEELAPTRTPVRTVQPAVQTAVAAATGFVAGAATMALLRRYGLARLERASQEPALVPQRAIQAHTYVVHVRQLG